MGLAGQTKARAGFCDLHSSLLHYFILQLAKRTSNLYMETSAVTGHNVKRVFYKLAETLIHSYGIFQPGQEVSLLQFMFVCQQCKGNLIPRLRPTIVLHP